MLHLLPKINFSFSLNGWCIVVVVVVWSMFYLKSVHSKAVFVLCVCPYSFTIYLFIFSIQLKFASWVATYA